MGEIFRPDLAEVSSKMGIQDLPNYSDQTQQNILALQMQMANVYSRMGGMDSKITVINSNLEAMILLMK